MRHSPCIGSGGSGREGNQRNVTTQDCKTDILEHESASLEHETASLEHETASLEHKSVSLEHSTVSLVYGESTSVQVHKSTTSV